MPVPDKLGGLIRRKLVRELAHGELNQTALAEKYEVSPSAISHFAKRNRDEIEAVRADMDDEFAGILIVQKAFRLGALQELFEKALIPQPKFAAGNGKMLHDENDEPVKEIALDSAARILKQAAEEMGQLPNRVSLSGNVDVHTTYTVLGVEPEDLA